MIHKFSLFLVGSFYKEQSVFFNESFCFEANNRLMTESQRHLVFCVFRGQARPVNIMIKDIVEIDQKVAVILFLTRLVWIVNYLGALANRITDTCFAGEGYLCSFGRIKAWDKY